jgi:proteasome assembly chaperone 3
MAQALSAMTEDIYALSISGIQQEPFPAKTKQAAGLIGGTETDISSISFSDKIMVTISQAGRLSQWVSIILSISLMKWKLN